MKVLALAFGTFAFLAPLHAVLAGIAEEPRAIPEPATLTLMAVGVGGALIAARLRKKK